MTVQDREIIGSIEPPTAAATTLADEAKEAEQAGLVAGKQRRRSLKPLVGLKGYVLRYKGMLAAACLALIVSAAATLVLPVAVRRMIDIGFGGSNTGLINDYFITLVGVGFVLAVSSAARFYYVNWLGERIVADIRSDVFNHLLDLSPSFYEATRSGEVTSRLTADTTQVKAAVGMAASQALRNLALLLGALVMMIVTSLKLSLSVLVAIPIIVLPLVGYGRAIKALSRRAQDTLGHASAYAAESLGQVRILQAFVHEPAARVRFQGDVESAFVAARARNRARAVLTAVAIFLVFASVLAILWFGAQDVMDGTMTGGHLGQFILYAVLAAASLGQLSETWGEVSQASGAAERLGELLQVEPQIVSPPDPVPMPQAPKGEIRFDHVTFHYPLRPTISALNDISFHVNRGERVAIVGPSGAGKTTIFSMVLRFYDPAGGVVSIDGVPVNKADLHDLRSHFALVPQEPALFADTIAANIRFGMAGAGRAEIEAAAKAAFAHDFIAVMPDGYDTLLGEGGVRLSAGQRQRIAIARALLRKAPILLLDEATSALDSESEVLVQRAFDTMMEGRTTLVIAHRLSTVTRADRILVLDGGRLVEDGTHQSLIGRGGMYARLAELQFAPDAAGS